MDDDRIDIEGVHQVTDEEGRAIFDNAARYYLNMSGDEFLRAWNEGKFLENGVENTRATFVSMLIPFAESR